MKELVAAVREYGIGIGSDIVKVDMFLNHRMDTELYVKIGQAFADEFLQYKPDLVLTVEASGIAGALTTAIACGNIPVVFAKKSRTRNVTGDVYESRVFSFTHGVENHIRVAKQYIPKGSRVLIVDDFLDAVLTGKQPELDVYSACEWTAVGLLSELSVTNGGRVIEMPKFRPGVPLEEQITKLW